MTLPIIVKESTSSNSQTATTTMTEEVVITDPVLSKILSESVSDDEKLKLIREAYTFKYNQEVKPEELDSLNEWNLSWSGKLFFAAAAAYIAGKVIKNMPLKIKGTKDQLKAISDAIVASKSFQDELKKPSASIESVVKKLNLKNMTRERFKQLTHRDFPL